MMSSILQIALAFIVVLVIPGFAASLAFFPRLNQLEVTERLAISIGLSITIVVAVGLFLGYAPALISVTGGIAPNSLLAALALISIFFLIVWALRAARLVIKASREVIKPKRGA
jgi:uncharacterized membrane protein